MEQSTRGTLGGKRAGVFRYPVILISQRPMFSNADLQGHGQPRTLKFLKKTARELLTSHFPFSLIRCSHQTKSLASLVVEVHWPKREP